MMMTVFPPETVYAFVVAKGYSYNDDTPAVAAAVAGLWYLMMTTVTMTPLSSMRLLQLS